MQEELKSLCEAASRSESILGSMEEDALSRYVNLQGEAAKETLFLDLSKRLLSASFAEEAIALLRVLACLWKTLSPSRRSMTLRIVFNTLKRFPECVMERFVYDTVAALGYSDDELMLVIESLKLSGLSISPNGSKHRIRCILGICGKSKGPSVNLLVRGFCPEIVLYVHDQSSSVRSLAAQLLSAFCSMSSEDQARVELLLTILCGGLAGLSLDMRSGSIACLGLAISQLWDSLDHNSRHKLLSTVFSFSLKDSTNSQLVRSSIRFIRCVLRRIIPSIRGGKLEVEQEELLKLCCAYYGSELLVSNAAKTACRLAIRRLTTKLGKKLGWECLRKSFVPQEHWALVRYAERFSNREIAQRRKNNERNRNAESSSDEEEEDALISKLHNTPRETLTVASDMLPKMVIKNTDDKTSARIATRKNLSNLAELRSKKEGRNERPSRSERQHDIIGLDTRSSKYSGDAKRRGKVLDPFAYVRLNPSLSKEKHKGSAVKSFKKILTISKKSKSRSRK